MKSVSVYGKRRLCGNRSPESALAILQQSPPDVVRTHDQTHATTPNFGPFHSTNLMKRHYLKAQEDPGGYLKVFNINKSHEKQDNKTCPKTKKPQQKQITIFRIFPIIRL